MDKSSETQLESENQEIINTRVLALKSDVVDQIAAGEVLERPAHMVKELIENSLDAGATELEIHLGEGGRSLTLIDNGRGFHPEDLKLALQRHTTSKLKHADDLWTLSTYGFRGEALASISAVSEMRIRTHRPGEKCVELKTEFGHVKGFVESSQDYGTRIEISRLYENTPARLKFLKTDASEVMEIKKVLFAFGLCQPLVSLKLFYRDHLEFYWPRVSEIAVEDHGKYIDDLTERNRNILATKELYFFRKDFGDIQVEVQFAPPHETAKSNRKLWTFVQSRWVQEPMILAAIRDGFQNTLLPGEYPIGAIFIHVPKDFVDVNVHPTKSKVKFKEQSQVYRAIRHTLLEFVELSPWRHDFLSHEKSITQNGFVFQKEAVSYKSTEDYANAVAKDSEYAQTDFDLKAFRSNTTSHVGTQSVLGDGVRDFRHIERDSFFGVESLKASVVSDVIPNMALGSDILNSDSTNYEKFNSKLDYNSDSGSMMEGACPSLQDGAVKSSFWSNLLVIGQVGKTYLVTQNQDEVVYIDQHAAHERYLFEKLWQDFKNGHALERQGHLLPISFKVDDESIVEILLKNEPALSQLGILFEQSGPRHIEITETPAIIKDKAVVKALEKMVEQILKFGESFIFEDVISDIFATMACHSAIRAGQILTLPEMEELLELMDQYSTTSYCPHGRPVFVRYSFYQIEKDFCRKF